MLVHALTLGAACFLMACSGSGPTGKVISDLNLLARGAPLPADRAAQIASSVERPEDLDKLIDAMLHDNTFARRVAPGAYESLLPRSFSSVSIRVFSRARSAGAVAAAAHALERWASQRELLLFAGADPADDESVSPANAASRETISCAACARATWAMGRQEHRARGSPCRGAAYRWRLP